TAELEMAQTIVVPSSFVSNSLPVHLQKKAILAHFGSPTADPSFKIDNDSRRKNQKLKVLFVGSLTQRKGLADLFAAINELTKTRADIELHVMGSMRMPARFYLDRCVSVTMHPPQSKEAVFSLMRSADVFALPSLIEGCALVQQEAMICGLPIIITPNTGGSHLVVEGQTGFCVPAQSVQALAERLNWCAENREALVMMGRNARDRAAAITWHNYRSKIQTTVSKLTAN
ncbi:MAG: glycosyltransferase family 4 protein, partial [Cyanobacteria bacterium]|nr:glycosyltransferase family 4 protein [Cyanobacteriota bacterium]